VLVLGCEDERRETSRMILRGSPNRETAQNDDDPPKRAEAEE
jgi:hypothetical protein